MPAVTSIPRLSHSGSLELAARRVVEGLHAGRHRSPYTGPAVEFADHRPYLAGDDLRSVDWKAYARTDHLLVRRYREERDLPLALLLDTSASMGFSSASALPSKLAWAGLAAAVLALLACDQGDRVRVVGGASELGPWPRELGGPAGATAACLLIDSLSAGGAGDPAALVRAAGTRLSRRTLVLLLSDLLLDPAALGAALAPLAARGHDLAVIQVLDPSELALPADWERVALSDPEGRHPDFTCDAADAKAGFDAAMARHVAACATACAGARADHVLADSSRDVAEVVGGWLHRRGHGPGTTR